MSELGRALIASLTPEDIEALAERLMPHLVPPTTPSSGEWLDTAGAAEFLGVSVPQLRRLVADHGLPVHQDQAGRRLHFRRSELETWHY